MRIQQMRLWWQQMRLRYDFRAYQCLNVLIVLGDTLDVSWALPGGQTYSVQSAPAQNQAYHERKCIFVDDTMETDK